MLLPNHFQRPQALGFPHLSKREKGLAFFSHCKRSSSPPSLIPPPPPPSSTTLPPPPFHTTTIPSPPFHTTTPSTPPTPPTPHTPPPHILKHNLAVLGNFVPDLVLLASDPPTVKLDLLVLPEMKETRLDLQPVGVHPHLQVVREGELLGLLPSVNQDSNGCYLVYLEGCLLYLFSQGKWLCFLDFLGSLLPTDFEDRTTSPPPPKNGHWYEPWKPPYCMVVAYVSLFQLTVVGSLVLMLPGLVFRSLTTTGNLSRLAMVLYPHETYFQALRVLIFCPPTDGPVLDRSIVALDAWGCLPCLVVDNVSNVGRIWFLGI